MKATWIIGAVLAVGITVPVISQPLLPRKAYMHLTGRMDDQTGITLNLVKVYDSLYGDLTFHSGSLKPQVLTGSLAASGEVFLTIPYSDSSWVFTGSFVNRYSLTGTISNHHPDSLMHVVLVETYPEGSTPLLVYLSRKTEQLTKKENGPEADARLILILPGESSNPIISDSLKTLLLENFLSSDPVSLQPDSVLNHEIHTFFKNYRESNESLLQSFPDAGSLSWVLWKTMHVLYNDCFLLSAYTTSYAYTGGAHGMEPTDHAVIDMRTGKKLKLNELFNPNFAPALSRMLTQTLKSTLGIPEADNLSDHGYFVETISPSENFFLTGNGIGFHYNQYEIAPYANGSTDIILPIDRIFSLIRKDGPLAPLLLHR